MLDKQMPTPDTLRNRLRYDPETGNLYWIPDQCRPEQSEGWWVGKQAGYVDRTGYRRLSLSGKKYLAHRIAWAIHYGSWPINEIDHINGNKLDNRIVNLRNVSRADNNRNLPRRKSNTSGVTGVRRVKLGKWRAMIKIDGKHHLLGSFVNFEDAVAARKAAEVEYGFHHNHGREARDAS